ncbi:helix-turn-helix domain-containing protein [Streptomyces bathyalis]|nr:helix-turn-helix domain-containing protein [Streptomyces bathyalis]
MTPRSEFGTDRQGELLDQPARPTLRATLTGWAESGFSLVRAAEQLPVHRNTLIYRLEKISRLSGADVRDPKRALATYLACVTDLVDLPERGATGCRFPDAEGGQRVPFTRAVRSARP